MERNVIAFMNMSKMHEQQLRLLGDILSALSVDKLIYAKGRIWFLKEWS